MRVGEVYEFVDETDEVPEGSIVIFSAHGVSPQVHKEAADRNLKNIDATCPLVTKFHQDARRFAKDDLQILLIGHEGHEEVEGTAGEAPDSVLLIDGLDDVEKVVVKDDTKVLDKTKVTVEDVIKGITSTLPVVTTLAADGTSVTTPTGITPRLPAGVIHTGCVMFMI